MTRALLPVATAVFTLISMVHGLFGTNTNVVKANAVADAQIHLYSFAAVDCTGESTTPLELKQGECVNFHQALSVRPRFRSDYAGWVDEVNGLRTQCKLLTFTVPGCHESNMTDQYWRSLSGDMPKNLERCLVSRHQQFEKDNDDDLESSDDETPRLNSLYSAKFVCGKVENPELLCTSTVEHTSWSIDWIGAPHQAVHTATYSGSLSATGHIAARSVATENAPSHQTLEPRGFKPGSETKGVLMIHPWTQALVCYLCYPKKEHNYTKVECRYGLNYPAKCEGSFAGPDGKPTTAHTTTTSTTRATTTTHATVTSIKATSSSPLDAAKAAGRAPARKCVPPASCVCPSSEGCFFVDDMFTSSSDSESEQGFPQLDGELSQKKSWHTPVKFDHPFIPDQQACADAEWEKRGNRDKEYVKIQHIHKCDDNDRKDSQWIGIPKTVVHTVQKKTTTTNIIEHTRTRRHDQL